MSLPSCIRESLEEGTADFLCTSGLYNRFCGSLPFIKPPFEKEDRKRHIATSGGFKHPPLLTFN